MSYASHIYNPGFQYCSCRNFRYINLSKQQTILIPLLQRWRRKPISSSYLELASSQRPQQHDLLPSPLIAELIMVSSKLTIHCNNYATPPQKKEKNNIITWKVFRINKKLFKNAANCGKYVFHILLLKLYSYNVFENK